MKKASSGIIAVLLALVFSLCPHWAIADDENLITNGSFELVDALGHPVGWYTEAWNTQPGYTQYEVAEEGSQGERSAFLYNLGMNDARYAQRITVEPNAIYKLTGYIRTEDVPDSGWGANLSIGDITETPPGIYGTQSSFVKVESYGITGENQTSLVVFVRLGGYSGESEGKAYFDDISLVKVEELPAGKVLTRWYREETPVVQKPDIDNGETADSAWPWFAVSAVLYLLLGFALLQWLEVKRPLAAVFLEKDTGRGSLSLVLGVTGALLGAFVLRALLAPRIPGYAVDIQCFVSWGHTMAKYGPSGFYANAGFCDYPPGYLLVLWLNGLVAGSMNPLTAEARLIIVKFAPILADIAAAAILFVVARKKLPEKAAAALAVLYAFNPAAILNSAAWGQIDSVLALLLLLVAALAIERKWHWVLPIYVLAVLTKPQALMFGPLGLAAIIMALWQKHDKREWIRLGIGLGASLAVAALVILPFRGEQESGWLVGLYTNTMSYYNRATVNAANFYYLMDANWVSLETLISTRGKVVVAITGMLAFPLAGLALWRGVKAGVKDLFGRYFNPILLAVVGTILLLSAVAIPTSYNSLGIVLMALCILWSLITYVRGKSLANLPFMGAAMLILLCVFGTQMHERYLFPVIILLALAYVQKRDWRILALLIGVSATTLLNAGIVLDNSIRLGAEGGHLNNDTRTLNMAISALNVVMAGCSVYLGEVLCAWNKKGRKLIAPPKDTRELMAVHPGGTSGAEERLLHPADSRLRLGRKDYLIMGIVTLLYAVVAFFNLGSVKAPQTTWQSVSSQEAIVFDLGESRDFRMLYYGYISLNDFSVSVSEDGEQWTETYSAKMNQGECFRWQYLVHTSGLNERGEMTYNERLIRELHGRYVRINAETVALHLGEVLFRTPEGENIPVTLVDHQYPADRADAIYDPATLIDEQDSLVGGEPGWYNSTYFDEIYHARTAYEHLHGISPYEWTHPPLGKVIMSFFVAIFGMTPFGWRFAGALMGVIMVPVMYLLGKQVTKRRSLATAAMLLMTFDMMHFTQTRIATIDSFVVLFIMVSQLCMLYYIGMDFHGKPLRKTLIPLALSGLFMGLGIAAKWTGIYSGIALALLFFWSCVRRLREGYAARKLLAEGGAIPEERASAVKNAAENTWKRLLITCLWCLLFFVAVPIGIFYLSYIPHFAPSGGVSFDRIIAEQLRMFNYHAQPGLGMDHGYYSPWWQWPIIGKPMWFFSSSYTDYGTASTIVCFGNPAVWYTGLAALFIMIGVWIRRHIWRDDRGCIVHLHTREHDMMPAAVLIGFMAQYLPWVLVPRGTYIYHYFASVPFIILCTVLVFKLFYQRHEKAAKIVLWTLVAVAGILFVAFFPFASGVTVSRDWLSFMNWLPGRLPY